MCKLRADPKCPHCGVPACSTNISVYRSVQQPCGAPDVPHVALECRNPLAEGIDVGVLKAPPVSASDFSNDDQNDNLARGKNGLQTNNISKLTFKISPVASLEVKWETTLVKDVLYVELPSGILPEGSKESLITLLEYAEEGLRCSHVVLCISKNRSDRGSLLRVFNFFGFQIMPPGHSLIRNPSSDLLHMVYAIEPDDEDDDDGDDDEDEGEEEEEEEEETGSSEDDAVEPRVRGGGGGKGALNPPWKQFHLPPSKNSNANANED